MCDLLNQIKNSKQPLWIIKQNLDTLFSIYNETDPRIIFSLIFSNTTTIPHCPICGGNQVPRPNRYAPWSKTCSIACANEYQRKRKKCKRSKAEIEESNLKRRNTNLEKYGAVSPLGNKEISEKMKQRNLEKYGMQPQALKEVKEKTKQTVKSKYGVEHVFKSEKVKDKIKQTNLERYGVEHNSMTTEVKNRMSHNNPMMFTEVITRVCSTQKEKYGGMGVGSEITGAKIKESLIEKYGVDNIFKSKDHRDKIKLSWYVTYFSKYPGLEDYILNLDPNEIEPTSKSYFREFVIPDEFKTNWQFITDYLERNGVVFIRESKSTYEEKICKFLDSINVQYIVGDRTVLHPKEIDILIKDSNIGIEINGLFWHDSRSKDKKYHSNKTNEALQKGIQILHIFDYEIDDDNLFKIWKSIILSKLNKTEKIYARKTKLVYIGPSEHKKFMSDNHLQGPVNSKINIGLLHEDTLVAVGSFGKYRFSNSHEWELLRFATKIGITVVGGFSKILSEFISSVNPINLVSYANRRWSMGNVYVKNGFEEIGSTNPGYFYHKNGNIYSRQQFQKHKLINILEFFNEKLTEEENCNNNGYYRCYDSGNIKYLFSPK